MKVKEVSYREIMEVKKNLRKIEERGYLPKGYWKEVLDKAEDREMVKMSKGRAKAKVMDNVLVDTISPRSFRLRKRLKFRRLWDEEVYIIGKTEDGYLHWIKISKKGEVIKGPKRGKTARKVVSRAHLYIKKKGNTVKLLNIGEGSISLNIVTSI